MDIDDVLAEVGADSIPREQVDLQDLTRAWVTERVAPELLPYPEALMERALERIRKQVRRGVFLPLANDPWEPGAVFC